MAERVRRQRENKGGGTSVWDTMPRIPVYLPTVCLYLSWQLTEPAWYHQAL